MLILGGDFLKGDGTGSFSIYGDKFPVSKRALSCRRKNADALSGRELFRKACWPRIAIDGSHIFFNFCLGYANTDLTTQANSGPNTNGCQVIRWFVKSISGDLGLTTMSQFFITTAKCDFLDGKHVVFGKVIDGMLTLRKIENVSTGPNNRPKLAVKIVGESK